MDDQQHDVTASAAAPDSDPHAECAQRLAEFEAKWKRALADYQNREKDIARERDEFARWATADLVRDFLPIADAIEAGSRKPEAGSTDAADGSDASGYRLSAIGYAQLHRLCRDFLKRHGVESVGAVGDRVDYLLHEVIGTRTEEGKEAGTILEITQVGYQLHGRLLRPATVVVSA